MADDGGKSSSLGEDFRRKMRSENLALMTQALSNPGFCSLQDSSHLTNLVQPDVHDLSMCPPAGLLPLCPRNFIPIDGRISPPSETMMYGGIPHLPPLPSSPRTIAQPLHQQFLEETLLSSELPQIQITSGGHTEPPSATGNRHLPASGIGGFSASFDGLASNCSDLWSSWMRNSQSSGGSAADIENHGSSYDRVSCGSTPNLQGQLLADTGGGDCKSMDIGSEFVAVETIDHTEQAGTAAEPNRKDVRLGVAGPASPAAFGSKSLDSISTAGVAATSGKVANLTSQRSSGDDGEPITCFNCGRDSTVRWRNSRLNPGQRLCNPCGIYERSHKTARPLNTQPRCRTQPCTPRVTIRPKSASGSPAAQRRLLIRGKSQPDIMAPSDTTEQNQGLWHAFAMRSAISDSDAQPSVGAVGTTDVMGTEVDALLDLLCNREGRPYI